MIDLNVVEYIKAETAKGVSREKIESDLVQGGGWSKEDIQEHFLAIDNNTVESHIAYQKQNSKADYSGNSLSSLFGTNIAIFIFYFVVSFANFDFLIPLYLGHILILLGLGVINFFKKKNTNTTDPAYYFITAFVLFMIGFGSCIFLISLW